MMTITSRIAGAALIGALALTGCATQTATPQAATSAPMSDHPMSPTPSTTDHSMSPSATMMAHGMFLTYDEYKSKMSTLGDAKTVLFFAASWCPDCKATEASLMKDGVPAGLTVVKVDYDSMTDLKKKYGITQQHSFVQVDKMGDKLAMWTGTLTGADILAKTKNM